MLDWHMNRCSACLLKHTRQMSDESWVKHGSSSNCQTKATAAKVGAAKVTVIVMPIQVHLLQTYLCNRCWRCRCSLELGLSDVYPFVMTCRIHSVLKEVKPAKQAGISVNDLRTGDVCLRQLNLLKAAIRMHHMLRLLMSICLTSALYRVANRTRSAKLTE